MHSVLNLVLTTILCRKRQEDDNAGPSDVKKKKASQKKKKSPKRKKMPKKKKTPVKEKSNRRLPPHHSLELSGACHSSLIPNSLLKSLIPES